jgi:anti-anti-sigma factor
MKVKHKDDSLILQPESDLVASRIEHLRDAVLVQMKKHADVSHVVLDAKGIELVDSLGVNLIIGIYRQSVAESKTFEIVNAGDKFMKVAHFFRFPSLFNVTGETEAK